MFELLVGDAIEKLRELPDESVDCIVTSPPYYGLRDYGTGKWVGGDPDCPHRRVSKWSAKTITGHAQKELAGNVGDAIYKTVCPLCGAVREDKQIGLEETPEEYIERLVAVFRECRRVLKDDGTLWVNIGDSYAGTGSKGDYKDPKYADGRNGQVVSITQKVDGYKNKDLIGIPWMLAFALRGDGWFLRQDIIWHKPNPMPESVKDRCVKSHEYIFLLSKKPHYYFDYEAIQEEANYDGRKETMFKGSTKYEGVMFADDKTKSFERWQIKTKDPQYKNLKEKGQSNHTMHERRAEGLPDEVYFVRNKRDVWQANSKYSTLDQETAVRQGMNRERGINIVAVRKRLPSQEQFVAFMRKNTTVQMIQDETDIPRTTIEHWFRTDESGFSFPTVEDWCLIRDYVDDWSEEFQQINLGMTEVTYETDAIDKNYNGKKNKRDVWSVTTKANKEAHFATFPEKLIEPCILAGCRKDGTVLDPFCGSGTTGIVSVRNERRFIGVELNPEYAEMSERRIAREESYGIQESMF